MKKGKNTDYLFVRIIVQLQDFIQHALQGKYSFAQSNKVQQHISYTTEKYSSGM